MLNIEILKTSRCANKKIQLSGSALLVSPPTQGLLPVSHSVLLKQHAALFLSSPILRLL